MRYGVCIPHAGRFCTPDAITTIARACEDAGYDSIWVSDHIVVPEGHSYIPEIIDEPLAVLAYLASVTQRVTIGTSVLIVPYRDPVFTAKFLSTADVLSDGRLVVGVGIGWLEEEFDALGVPFGERAARTDEYLRVYRNLWETDTSTFDGRFKRYRNMRMFPKTARDRDGTIPIWVGGNTQPAIRRAADLGDGWHPINLTVDQFAAGVDAYRSACDRETGPVCMRWMPGFSLGAPERNGPFTGSPEEQAPDVRAYAKAGLDELMLSPATGTVGEFTDLIARFATDVIPRV